MQLNLEYESNSVKVLLRPVLTDIRNSIFSFEASPAWPSDASNILTTSMDHSWAVTDQGTPQYSDKNCPIFTFSITNLKCLVRNGTWPFAIRSLKMKYVIQTDTFRIPQKTYFAFITNNILLLLHREMLLCIVKIICKI